MLRFKSLALMLSVLMACGTPELDNKSKSNSDSKNEIKMDYTDHHSFAKPAEAVVKHLDWKAKVDFEKKVISALATYSIENLKGVDTIHLDSRNLIIKEVRRDDKEGALGFKIENSNSFLGSKLSIPISKETKTISIDYETTEGADALQFLDPVQTAGKKHPFLFTQSQAILARTWLPSQDGPGVRFTYDAEVTVPKGMLALMSATNPTTKNESGVYTFKMEQAIPSYLFALAVGNIEYQSLGDVAGVYAEPELLEASAYEFANMQDMVDTAESLYGDYRWGKYDVIVLPPSFPFGGMENPRLTFATPTIIAGDRSLTALIAHELAHSWSGNLVTNANWEDIWLNEGFTVYFENRIMEEIYGKDFANMLAILSYQDLNDEIDRMKSENRLEDTRLKVDLEGRNPDDGLTAIPYDKGYFLLRLIEETVGRENWDAFLKEYFNEYAFQVMTTEVFLHVIDEKLLSKDSSWANTIKINEWVYEGGLPANCPKVTSTKFEIVDEELLAFNEGTLDLETEGWVTQQWMYFIRELPNDLSEEQMKGLDQNFGFTESGNSEIKSAWFEKVIPNNYAYADEAVQEFLVNVGRRKFLVPIYKAILQSNAGIDRAKNIYEIARPNYHAVSTETLDKMLEYKKG
jgi:aminopeptidase N